jgi:hypothetical protein
MERSKLIAIITGVFSIVLAVGYLLLVTLLDFRGEMLPAPQSQLPVSLQIQQLGTVNPKNIGIASGKLQILKSLVIS